MSTLKVDTFSPTTDTRLIINFDCDIAFRYLEGISISLQGIVFNVSFNLLDSAQGAFTNGSESRKSWRSDERRARVSLSVVEAALTRT